MNTSGSTNKVAVAACPFCGGTDTACGIADEEFGRFWVECICGARGPTVETLKDARPAWNKRLAPEPAGDVVAAMLDYNQMLRSFAMIASRNGEQTRWEGLYEQIHALLEKHHETWKRYFPPMQPDDEQPETKAGK